MLTFGSRDITANPGIFPRARFYYDVTRGCMMRKKYIWLILIVTVIVIILVGGKLYMNKTNEEALIRDRKIENKIAKEFAKGYLTPEKRK